MIDIELRCPEYDTVVSARRDLDNFLDFMDYECSGYIKEQPSWRTHDYSYWLEIHLPDLIDERGLIIQGAFDEFHWRDPVRQVKRYLLIRTHL